MQQTAYLIRDRLSWMRFWGLGPGEGVPDANTLWDFCEVLIKARTLGELFRRLDLAISQAGYLPMGGQIIDAALVAAHRQRNTDGENDAIKAGQIPQDWQDKPAKLRQKDCDSRWTVKFSKAKPKWNGSPQIYIAIPTFGYKNHISIDRQHGIIHRSIFTDAAAADGARLHEVLIDPNNTASPVWADTAYRSQVNEDFLAACGKVSRIHQKKPRGKPMLKAMGRANALKSIVRARVKHAFAEQTSRMCLFRRTIGEARAEAAMTLANMAYNMKRWCWLDRQVAGD